MGYHLITESGCAPGARSHVRPKTHTPLSRLQERGLRYYSPGLGRWVSRDPIGEWGGVNLSGALANNPPNRRDRLGLELTENQCQNATNYFYRFNPDWKNKVDYWNRQPGKKKCTMEIACDCCPGDKRGGARREVSEPYRHYKVTICRDKADSSSVYTAIAHELTHFFAGCADLDDAFPCATMPVGQDYFDCNCAQYLCGEVRAFLQSGACVNPDECWERLVNGGYLNDAPCKPPTPYSAPNRSRIWGFMEHCRRIGDLPLPHFPQPLPNL
jgi:RHS repeat-associated protein